METEDSCIQGINFNLCKKALNEVKSEICTINSILVHNPSSIISTSLFHDNFKESLNLSEKNIEMIRATFENIPIIFLNMKVF